VRDVASSTAGNLTFAKHLHRVQIATFSFGFFLNINRCKTLPPPTIIISKFDSFFKLRELRF
jgi:hypothetical protein